MLCIDQIFGATVLSLAVLAAPLDAQENKQKHGKAGDAATAELTGVIQTAWSKGQWAKVSDAADKLVAVDPNNGRAWYQLGYSLHAQKKYDRALAAHLKASRIAKNPKIQQPATYNVACVHAIRNEKDKAFEWLDKAVAVGFTQLGTLKSDPDMDNLRDDPRFAKLLGRVEKVHVAAPQQAYASVAPRRSARVAYFGNGSSGGQVAIDHGSVSWQDKYQGILDNERFVGQRWRLGSNFWTNLDNNVPLTISGTKVGAGLHYLTLTHRGDQKFTLTLLDPVEVRKKRLDAYVASRTVGGIEVEMQHSTSEQIADELKIEFKMERKVNTAGKLVIRFGPHVLTAPIQVHTVN